MTRWARAGNSQKHKKMPDDPSSWEELSSGIKKSVKSNQSKHNLEISKMECKQSKSRNITNENESKNDDYTTKDLPIKTEKNDDYTTKDFPIKTEKNDTKKDKSLSKRQLKKLMKAENKKQKLDNINEITKDFVEKPNKAVVSTQNSVLNADFCATSSAENLETSPVKPLSKGQLRRHRKKMKKSQLSNNLDTENNLEMIKKSPINKNISKKREKFYQNLQKERAKKGIMLLSPKVEHKLYLMKKKMRGRGALPEEIKAVIRKERRKAELQFRRTMRKTCYNCRQPGHILAECPLPVNESKQETGKCFKCGSAEHTSVKCKSKVSGYPFATCFICKTEGHISSDCPSNQHGVYPKGGRCNLCDNINHLRKDCPSLIKKEEEDTVILPTINDVTSIDDEIVDIVKRTVDKKDKKPKIIKF